MQRCAVFALAVLCGAMSLVACSGESPSSPSPAAVDGPSGSAASAQAASRSIAPMIVFPNGPELPGTSTLTRTDGGISMTVHATDLIPNNAYTVWFVIFNDPGQCAVPDDCAVPDVFANRGTPSLRLAAGHVVGGSGLGDFGGHLSVGDTGGPACSSNPATLGSCGPGLLDARNAIVHLVVRSHGPAIPDLVSEQISSFLGACSINGCANVQAAIHKPVQ